MALVATVELNGLVLPLDLGTYQPGDCVPDHHLLDLILEIDPAHALVTTDEMSQVFDYDPLIATILKLAGARHYETQEYLITLIAKACAAETAIKAAEIFLYKTPVSENSGALGVRVKLSDKDLAKIAGKADSES